MAQIIPPITSLPVDSSVAPSVEDIQDRLPSICVDYLSHDWTEEDVWASWRSMTRHKHEIANGVRLENASWRTWNKQRNKLATISPETLNWLKDSDVTWLYGPLHTANVEPVRPLKQSTTDERYGIDRPSGMKPILKHRTLSELLTIPNPSSPILESVSGDDVDSLDGESIASVSSGRPHLLQTKSDTNIVRNRSVPSRRRSPPRHPITNAGSISGGSIGMGGESASGSGVALDVLSPDNRISPDGSGSGSGKKHITFNTFVEQCVAVDAVDVAGGDSSFEESPDSEDDMLEMRSVSSRSSRSSSRPSLSRHSSSGSGSEHLTIAKIAPTMLKTTGSYHNTNPALPQMIYQPTPEYRSPQTEVPPPGSPLDFPSPQIGGNNVPRWQSTSAHGFGGTGTGGAGGSIDDDGYGSIGFDYFGGPDLSSSHGGSAQSGDGNYRGGYNYNSGGYGRAPAVNQPPAQPKWRQQQQHQQAQPASPAQTAVQTNTPSSVNLSPNAAFTGDYRLAYSPTSPTAAAAGIFVEPSSVSSSFSFGASPSSSSSNSLTNGIGSPQPQPGRSILKVRTPGPVVGSGSAAVPGATAGGNINEPASPPSYFNYTPSVATGIGGMRSSYESPHPHNNSFGGVASSPIMSPPVPSGAPIPVPSTPSGEEISGGRGRSTSRGQGSSQFDRSTSRGTSVSSTSSIMSNTTANTGSARSPIDGSSSIRSRVHSAGSSASSGSLQGVTGSLDKVSEGETWCPSSQSTPGSSPKVASSSTPRSPGIYSAVSNDRSAAAQVSDPPPPPPPQSQGHQSSSQSGELLSLDATNESESNNYVPERSSTPTPHSSPQIALRSLKDTSPSSLPHTSTRNPSSSPADLPRTDPATSSGNHLRATVAHVPTNAQPTIAQPTLSQRHSSFSSTSSSNTQRPVPGAYGNNEENDDGARDGGAVDAETDGDGSTLIGRAANIANTAKDLLGALWYGEDQRRAAASGNGGGASGTGSGDFSGLSGNGNASGSGSTKRHGRGASLG